MKLPFNKLFYGFILFVTFTSTIVIIKKKITKQHWKHTIESDGKGYYAYLPAIFIYHDLSFSFINEYENKYYDKGNFSNFISPQPQGVENKFVP